MSRLTCPIQTRCPWNCSGVAHNRRCRRSLIELRIRWRAKSWLRPNRNRRADRGVPILGPREKRPNRFPARRQADHFGLVPAGSERPEHRGKIADDDQVDRITRPPPTAVGGGLRRRSQVLTKSGNVHLGHLVGCVKGIELVPQVIGAEPLDRQRELEVLKAVRAKQSDENDLVPFRQVGEHEPSLFPTGRNRTHAEGVLQEERIHLPVRATNGEQLDRQQDQQRQKQPRQEAEPKQPLPARVVVEGRGFQRREMVRVERHELEPVRLVGTVDDVNPNRLDAPPSHGDAKELPTRRVIQHRHADFKVVSLLGDGRVQESPRVRPR